MKKINILLLCFSLYNTAQAQYFKKVQTQKDYNVKNRFFLDLNLKMGASKEQILTKDLLSAYPQAINSQIGIAQVNHTSAFGFESQLNYFFKDGASWGVGLGLQYFQSKSDLSIDRMHVEYRSVDANGAVFRQLITTNKPLNESLKTTSISMPLVLKYKMDLGDRFGLVVDAGLLFNLSQSTQFDAKTSFDYEAIYRFQKSGNDYVAVYDNGVIPSSDSWLITKAQYSNTHSDANMASYFQSLQAQGYNVGLGVVASKSGKIQYKSGSLGFIIQPSVTYQYRDFLAIQVGGFLMNQSIVSSNENNNMMITDKLGSYNSVLNNVGNRSLNSYGFKLGISYQLAHFSSMLPSTNKELGLIN